ncbi:MAG: uridine kinase [Candidatus Eisenbacteria bacterium]|uniref:Uridine kinase n=1 Tax=Eiseniibacteriota bacterium TaxID=2212470 RepID=A0A849SSA5_UNCEI|nr:uridine kinase [Candidatus Eisenbacteria bacterium]
MSATPLSSAARPSGISRLTMPVRRSELALRTRTDFVGHIAALAERVMATPPARPAWARLIALSGIDASGKGLIARHLAAAIERLGLRTAVIGLDEWHQPPAIRFGDPPGEHFYRHAFDFEGVFARVLEPLRLHRMLHTLCVRPHPHDGTPRGISYRLDDIDVVLFEGVFALRRDLRPRYDLRVWVDCPFEIALERARARN